jgi:20S proteasome alpha/beta subunit
MLPQLLILLSSSFSQCGGAASKNSATFFSPVHELGPSLAASVAGGTVIAVRSPPDVVTGVTVEQNSDDLSRKDISSIDSLVEESHDDYDVGDDNDESIVLLFRSPMSSSDSTESNYGGIACNLTVTSVFGSIDDSNNNNYHHDRLTFLPNGPVGRPFLSNRNSNLRVLHANSGLIMAATGFASDAEHLLNVAAGRVLSRISVYDTPSSSSLTSGKSIDPHRLVREDLSSMMIDAAMSDGGRPWGVQLLVIGQSALSRNQVLDIYTIDASGGWRHRHGTVAAIGRGAERIFASLLTRKDLSKEVTTKSSGWRWALDVAMNAAIHTFEMNEEVVSKNDALNDPAERYSAVVIFGNNSRRRRTTSRCAAVCSDTITECYNRARARALAFAREYQRELT